MDMIARAVAFVEMAVAAKMQEIEFVNQALALQQVDRAIDGDARDVGIYFLCTFEDFASVEMPAGGFHDLEQDAALFREADSPSAEFLLEAARRLVNVDAFTG